MQILYGGKDKGLNKSQWGLNSGTEGKSKQMTWDMWWEQTMKNPGIMGMRGSSMVSAKEGHVIRSSRVEEALQIQGIWFFEVANH